MEIESLLLLMQQRKSIRSFNPDKEIASSDVKLILEAGRLAPSAGNMQTWHFFLIKDREKKRMIADAAYGQSFISDAPLVIVVAIDKIRATRGYGNRGLYLYGIQDTAAAIEHILLAARALKIGSCWVGAFNEEKLENVLYIDRDHYRTVAIIPLGYSEEHPRNRGRNSLADIITEL
ncbi:MAG: nitroreductase family protein [Spirochaetales bacterium]|nr:nitroreductase family protein [Spirochaetales bacterium]